MSDFLKDVIEWYTRHNSYFYVPKGGSFSNVQAMQKKLRVLAKLDNTEWDQTKYWKLLKQDRLTSGDVAIARMIRNTLNYIGFTYIDIDDSVVVTTQGIHFTEASTEEAKAIIEKQLWKLRLSNPAKIGSSATSEINLRPHLSLCRLALKCGDTLSKSECLLFGFRMANPSDIIVASKFIQKWRALSVQDRTDIERHLDSRKSTRALRKTIKDNSAYILALHRAPEYMDEQDSGFRIIPQHVNKMRWRLNAQKKNYYVPKFTNFAEWEAYFGEDREPITIPEAVEQIAKTYAPDNITGNKMIVKLLKRQGASKTKLRTVLLERHLESVLEKDPSILEANLKLCANGQQFSCAAGRMDLLCHDKSSTAVLELKRAKTGDEIIGQCLRYMGFAKSIDGRKLIKPYHDNVRGILIAGAYDEKIAYAMQAIGDQSISAYKYKVDSTIEPEKLRSKDVKFLKLEF